MKNPEKPSPELPIMWFLLCLGVVFTFFYIPTNIAMAASNTPAHSASATYTRLFYYQGGSVKAKQSFLFNADKIDIFAPQTYSLDSDGKLSGFVNSDILAFAIKRGIKVMPLVTNGAFSQSSYKGILDDPAKQDTAIKALVDEAKKNGYSGWQIDFEQMDVSYKDKFSAFVKKTYEAMKQNNLSLSVAVIAKTSDSPTDYPNNLWQTLIGSYNYDALAANSDFISVMSYDDPYSLGPIAEYSWLKKVLTYSLAHIPKEKISLGLAFYYWQWNDTTGEFLGAGGANKVPEAIQKYKAATYYSQKEQAPYLTFWKDGHKFFIWYENAKSISQKVALIKAAGLHGFSAWALGLEHPSVWAALK